MHIFCIINTKIRWILLLRSACVENPEIVILIQDIAKTNKRPIDDVKKSEIAAILKNTALEAAQTHAEKLNLYDMFRGNLKVCLLSHTTNSLSL